MIIDYIVEIGLDAVKDKHLNATDRKSLQDRLKNFIERQRKINFECALEEEIDFGGLAGYIQNDLMEDVQLRLFGNKGERDAARTNIINRAASYSKAHTSLTRKRAIQLTETAIDILQDFYKIKINRELKFIATQIEDTIINATSDKLNAQKKEITDMLLLSEERTVKKIIEANVSNFQVPIATNMQQMREGMIEQVESNFADWFDAVGCTHKLFPNYCFDIESETRKFYSKPLTQEAIQKYPPKISCTGTIQINGRKINKIDCNTIDYVNRHQFPITLNIVTAKKYLGNEIDPIQHEAEKLIGETVVLSPKPFPPAFPCSISLDGDVVFDYILFRTQEIMDDGTVIISNREQPNCPFRIKMTANQQTQQATYSISTVNPSNEDSLQYLRFLKRASSGAVIMIKVLSLGEELAKAKFSSLDYMCGFDSVDDELAFLEKIVKIERYFDEQITIPEEIFQDDFRTISYLATLIQGNECSGSWSKLEFSIQLTEDLQNRILKSDDAKFCLSYVGSISVTLYGKQFELPIIKTFDSVKYQNIKRLKQKVEVLDIGDNIKLSFLPGDDQNGIWRDELYAGDKVRNF